MKIIYLKDDNTIACLVPTPDALTTMTIELDCKLKMFQQEKHIKLLKIMNYLVQENC